MTKTERKALQAVQGGVEMLRNAIVNGDPYRELELRARDLLAEVRSIVDGKSDRN